MSFESKNKDTNSWYEKNFLDYVRSIRKNLKDFVNETFSSEKESEAWLNNLKDNVASDKKVENSNVTSEGIEEQHNEQDKKRTSESKPDKTNTSIEKDKKGLKDKLKEICVRGRKYWDVNKNDEWFVSFWKLQFHGDKSKKILNNIKSTDQNRFNSIMTDSLFKNIDKAATSKRNDTQANQFKKLMEDPKAQQEMDKVVDETIEWYIDKIKSWWVTNDKAILAFWRICNYWSWYAQTIKNKMAQGGADFNNYKEVIERFEKSEKSKWKTTTSQKFKKKSSWLWGKSVEEVIEEYSA